MVAKIDPRFVLVFSSSLQSVNYCSITSTISHAGYRKCRAYFEQDLQLHKAWQSVKGPSIKYVTLFLANIDSLPLSHFLTHSGPPKKNTPHISDPPDF